MSWLILAATGVFLSPLSWVVLGEPSVALNICMFLYSLGSTGLRLVSSLQVLFIGLVLISQRKLGSRDGAGCGKHRLWYPGSCPNPEQAWTLVLLFIVCNGTDAQTIPSVQTHRIGLVRPSRLAPFFFWVPKMFNSSGCQWEILKWGHYLG